MSKILFKAMTVLLLVSSSAFAVDGVYHAGKCEWVDGNGEPHESDCCDPGVNCTPGSSDGDDCDVVVNGITYNGNYQSPLTHKWEKFSVCRSDGAVSGDSKDELLRKLGVISK